MIIPGSLTNIIELAKKLGANACDMDRKGVCYPGKERKLWDKRDQLYFYSVQLFKIGSVV